MGIIIFFFHKKRAKRPNEWTRLFWSHGRKRTGEIWLLRLRHVTKWIEWSRFIYCLRRNRNTAAVYAWYQIFFPRLKQFHYWRGPLTDTTPSLGRQQFFVFVLSWIMSTHYRPCSSMPYTIAYSDSEIINDIAKIHSRYLYARVNKRPYKRPGKRDKRVKVILY